MIKPSNDTGLNHNILRKKESAVIQPKLAVNSPGDIYEQEADTMADKVMRMENPVSGSDEITSSKPVIQRKHKGNETSAESLSSVNDVINSSSGKPLDSGTRAFMEPRFGHDFSKVRIHDNKKAAESAQVINALAYTVGNNIFFEKGFYDPASNRGRQLLAHELTHTIQQKSGLKIQRQEKKEETVISEDLKRKYTAVVFAESYKGQEQDIAWIYYNKIKIDGEAGLKGSAAYNGKSDNYVLAMLELGDTGFKTAKPKESWMKDEKNKKYSTVKEYMEKNGYYKTVGKARVESCKTIVSDIIKDPSVNPYKGWTGQGNMADFNNESNKDLYWTKARCYYWKQVDKKEKNIYVKVLEAGKNTQFIFNVEKIQEYYTKNPAPKSTTECKKYELPKK